MPEHPVEPSRTKGEPLGTKCRPLSRFQVYSLILGALGVAVAGGTGLAIYWQDRISSTLASIAHQQLANADRPWISVEANMLRGLRFGRNSPPQVFLKLAFRNLGKSPATDVSPLVTLVTLPAVGADPMLPIEAQEKLCAGRERRPLRAQWQTVFPGQETSINIDTGLPPEAPVPQKLASALPSQIANQIRPMIIGCVDYRYPTSVKLHQTGFIYVLNVGPNKRWPPLREGVDEPLSHLVLRSYALGGWYAN